MILSILSNLNERDPLNKPAGPSSLYIGFLLHLPPLLRRLNLSCLPNALQPTTGQMIISDKDEGTSSFPQLVKRTLQGGKVEVRIICVTNSSTTMTTTDSFRLSLVPTSIFVFDDVVLDVCIMYVQVPVGDGTKHTVVFPSALAMAQQAKKVPPEWLDARLVRTVTSTSTSAFARLLQFEW